MNAPSMWSAIVVIVIVGAIAGYSAFERWCEYKERTKK